MPSNDLSSDGDVGDLPPHTGSEVDLELPAGTLQQLVDLQRRHGDVFRLTTRGSAAETFVVAHPDQAQQVLSTQHALYGRFILDGHMSLVLGNGLLMSEGSVWMQQRKLLQRCLHGAALTGVVSRVAQCNAPLLDRWHAAAASGETVELTGAMVGLGIDFNFTALFGVDAPEMLEAVGADWLQRLTAPMKADTRSNLLFLRDAKRVRERLGELLAVRRRSPHGHVDLVSQFMEARHRDGGAMPDQQIVDEIVSVLTAGHETVASALKSVWYLIALHPPVAQALQREVDTVIGAAEPSSDHLDALTHTRQVICEALRIYPPIWIISRRAQQPARIGGYRVPVGTNVFVLPYLIHRHPEFWPDAEVFDPGRFAPDVVAARHSHAYIPYSSGPRHCIGDQLSMHQMLLHVATVTRQFGVAHVSGALNDYAAGFTLRSPAPIHVRVTPRA